MWIFVLYDLPTETAQQRKDFQAFQKNLIKHGFTMFQYSIYTRHCGSTEQATAQRQRVMAMLPPNGEVCIFTITDKQFGAMERFYNAAKKSMPDTPDQLRMF
jgi:CRISPR-associated protein Cas2